MSLLLASRRRITLLWLLIVVLGLAWAVPLVQANPAPPATPAPAPSGPAAEQKVDEPFFFQLVRWITMGTLWALLFILITMIVWLLIDIRGGVAMPLDFVTQVEDAVNKRRFKEAFDLAKGDTSMIGRVLTAGMTRLQHGLQEARDASNAVTESLKARKDHTLAYLATIGTLGPLLGLVGTVTGMIGAFAELGEGGTPNYGKLALNISHALWATLLGIGLSLPAIFFYSFFRNKLARITVDVNLMVDDLLTQMFHSSRRPAAEASSVAAAGAKTSPATSASSPSKPAEA